MTELSGKRRLAAILAADMVGFSRLMHADESGTLARQKQLMQRIILPCIAGHDGRLVKTTGDGLLAEFASAVEALNCAAAIQRDLAQTQADQPDDLRIDYRMGLNLGEVLPDGGDIFGDGVNVAARLEALADPGGILVSEPVFRTVRGKLDLGFADLGPLELKNISDPVQVFDVLLDPEDAGLVLDVEKPRRRVRGPVLAAVAVLIAGLFAVSNFFVPAGGADDPVPPVPSSQQSVSLLVLPYDAAPGTPTQYADAVSENLWRTMSRLRDMSMIPRAEAQGLRGDDPGSKFLAATHVMSGDVQFDGAQVTLTSHLNAVGTEDPIWQQVSTAPASELFAVLAAHKRDLALALNLTVTEAEHAILANVPTSDATAYLDFVDAERRLAVPLASNIEKTLRTLETAVQKDPRFGDAWAGIAQANLEIWRNNWDWIRPGPDARRAAETAADTALDLQPGHTGAQSVKVFLRLYGQEFDAALSLAEAGDTDVPRNQLTLGWALLASGQSDQARAHFDAFEENGPRPTFLEADLLARARVVLAQPDLALAVLQRAGPQVDTAFDPSLTRASALVATGDPAAARDVAKGILAVEPSFSLQGWRHQADLYANSEDWDRLAEGLETAGLPEWPGAYDVSHAEQRLDHDALTRLYETGFGSIKGSDERGGDLRYRARADGRLEMTNSWLEGKHIGHWRIDGALLCQTFETLNKGRKTCEQVYRDPDKPGRWIVQLTPFGMRRMGVAPVVLGPDK